MLSKIFGSMNNLLVQITGRTAQTDEEGEEIVGESVGSEDVSPFLEFGVKAVVFIIAACFIYGGFKYQHRNNSILTIVGKLALIGIGCYLGYELFMADLWGFFPKDE
jgi:hypothetical protein